MNDKIWYVKPIRIGVQDVKEQDWGVDENSWVSEGGSMANGFTGG